MCRRSDPPTTGTDSSAGSRSASSCKAVSRAAEACPPAARPFPALYIPSGGARDQPAMLPPPPPQALPLPHDGSSLSAPPLLFVTSDGSTADGQGIAASAVITFAHSGRQVKRYQEASFQRGCFNGSAAAELLGVLTGLAVCDRHARADDLPEDTLLLIELDNQHVVSYMSQALPPPAKLAPLVEVALGILRGLMVDFQLMVEFRQVPRRSTQRLIDVDNAARRALREGLMGALPPSPMPRKLIDALRRVQEETAKGRGDSPACVVTGPCQDKETQPPAARVLARVPRPYCRAPRESHAPQ